ncbi:ADP-ribosylation factor-related protein 1 [Trichinella spiralis]|uniref:ADP-ribosylation factor-related protein 1 n=1 Tax=Trichinella spiralis TaxID=6334 RepID=A0A0V1B9Q3_TRISP|nr:ADP-ribosylation factor-related protein 1 [Trichinella spiralis]
MQNNTWVEWNGIEKQHFAEVKEIETQHGSRKPGYYLFTALLLDVHFVFRMLFFNVTENLYLYVCRLMLSTYLAMKTFLESAKAKLNKQYKAMKPEAITTTVGLNIGKVVFDGVELNFWDLGGQKELQSLWDKYFAEAHGVIYIIDSSDQSRIEESLDAFEKALKNKTLNGVPVVIVCNKQDIKECMSVSDVKMALREIIKKLGTRDCSLFPVSALHGNNVLASISWLVKAIKKNSDYRPPS